MVDGSEQHDAPLVTVIVATYNRSNSLQLALKSILNQDFRNFEVLVVGDACTDDSEEVVRALADPRLHWMNLAENSGTQAEPNNTGLRLARGRYVAYLGHDDLWLPDHLSGLVGFIEETKADLVHSLCTLIGDSGIAYCLGPPRHGLNYDRHRFPPSSWMHRRDLIDACGFWRNPEELAWSIDFDFSRRAYLAGKSIRFYPRMTVLKFPSQFFRKIYSNRGELPQRDYWRRLQEDPHELEHEVLTELAIILAREHSRYGPWQPYFLTALRSLVYWLLESFGHDRWPLSVLMHRRFQRIIKKLRLKRGLPIRSGRGK